MQLRLPAQAAEDVQEKAEAAADDEAAEAVDGDDDDGFGDFATPAADAAPEPALGSAATSVNGRFATRVVVSSFSSVTYAASAGLILLRLRRMLCEHTVPIARIAPSDVLIDAATMPMSASAGLPGTPSVRWEAASAGGPPGGGALGPRGAAGAPAGG